MEKDVSSLKEIQTSRNSRRMQCGKREQGCIMHRILKAHVNTDALQVRCRQVHEQSLPSTEILPGTDTFPCTVVIFGGVVVVVVTCTFVLVPGQIMCGVALHITIRTGGPGAGCVLYLVPATHSHAIARSSHPKASRSNLPPANTSGPCRWSTKSAFLFAAILMLTSRSWRRNALPPACRFRADVNRHERQLGVLGMSLLVLLYAAVSQQGCDG